MSYVKKTEKDNKIVEKTYDGGRLKDIKHINKKTGSTHHHKVGRGIFGPFTGAKK